MNVWIRLIAWASIVALHYAVLWASPEAGCCGMGMVDYIEPILMIHVNEPDIWIHALLMLSVLVLIPLGSEVSGSKTPWMEVISACLLGLSLLARPVDPRVLIADDYSIRRIVPLGFVLSVPWLWVRARAAVPVVLGWLRHGSSNHDRLCLESAQVFPAIGAVWLVAHRASWTPWGFDPLIVLLTASHFHHAGFTLPRMAGLNARTNPNCWTRFSCGAILLGVPLVAVGITGTHFGMLKFVEPFGVAILVLGALSIAVSQVWRGLERQRSILTRLGFLISGASLFAAMVLALGFGLRYVIPNFALTMPQMWAIHGTLNAFGFGLCGILAWRGTIKRSGCP